MKKFNSKLVLAAALAVLSVGCGKSEQFQVNSGLNPNYQWNNNGSIPVSPEGPGVDNSGGNVNTGSNTVAFKPVSIAEFNSYVALHPLNNPTNFQLTVDMENVGNGRYAGNVKISYQDTGYQYQGSFDAGHGQNESIKGLHDNGLMEAEFNRWFIINGKYYFSAYFQDQYGAIVLVFDNYVNQGDGQGSGTVSGAVYYKNFAQSYAPQSPYRKCWYIYQGPYNCRADAVINKNSPYPGNGFRKLGTFSGLSKSAAMK
ncbi:hypothetical protein BDW_08550 [Bdellovibrio bacteriovorus W]|nr:hypothetical protein BDW_08550 [Bdellovibrio bacteriovorus W]